jgi:hypothetical protein
MSTGPEFMNLYVIFSAVNVGSTACSIVWLSNPRRINLTAFSDGKFPEMFTGGKFPESFRKLSGNFPETFPTMFAHRFLVAYFLTVLSTLP